MIHRQRCIDIRERILRLNPPLTDEILYHIPAYHAAIKIKRPLTDRSWNILVKKLEVGRGPAAEKIAEIEKASQGIRFTHIGRKATKAMKPWVDHFLVLDGGTIGRGSEALFALRVLSYVRTRWFDQEGSRIPLSALRKLWDEKLNSLLRRPGIIFMCAFCDKKHGLHTIFDHITIEHSKEMGWSEVITGTISSYWRNQEWPAELPILNINIPPGAIVEEKSHQIRMTEALCKTRAFMMLPDSHRFFLWFNLSIPLHSREYHQVTDIALFIIAAEDLRKSSRDRMFQGTLRCGICSAHQSKKKNPWVWTTLSQHFGSHKRFQEQWPEKLLMLPSKAEISKGCSIISDETVRQQWIMLVKEVDEELGRVLDDTMRLKEDEARAKSIREESGKGVKEKEKESRAGDLQLLKQDRREKSGESVYGKGSRAGDLQLLKRDREAGLLRIPKRGYEHEEDGREKRLKAGAPPPVHERPVNGYKNMPVPQFSGISPPDITEVSRAHVIATESTNIPPIGPAILAIAQKTQARTGIANSEPDRLPETRVIKDRDRSPSVNMDIEELFADA